MKKRFRRAHRVCGDAKGTRDIVAIPRRKKSCDDIRSGQTFDNMMKRAIPAQRYDVSVAFSRRSRSLMANIFRASGMNESRVRPMCDKKSRDARLYPPRLPASRCGVDDHEYVRLHLRLFGVSVANRFAVDGRRIRKKLRHQRAD